MKTDLLLDTAQAHRTRITAVICKDKVRGCFPIVKLEGVVKH